MLLPLQHVNPANPLQGGHDWLDWTDKDANHPNGQTRHPGADFNSGNGPNADQRFDVYAAACGWLRWKGWHPLWGNHCWIEHPNGDWTHSAHLDEPAFPVVDEWVEAGQHIGECGGSGGWVCHLHWEVAIRKPATWDQWPFRWPVESVTAFYHNPWQWLEHVAPTITAPHQEDELACQEKLAEVTADRDTKFWQLAEFERFVNEPKTYRAEVARKAKKLKISQVAYLQLRAAGTAPI